MSLPKLRRLERIDLRTAWKNEASDFTPWLASEDNIRLLGDTLDLDLEVEQQEAQVGPFRADILCRNTADNSLVVVENQPALKFNVVAKPNDRSKVVAEARSGGASLTRGKERQVAFWTEFGQVTEETGSNWKVPKPQPSSRVGYGIGRRGFGLYPTVSVTADRVAVCISWNRADALAFFHLLHTLFDDTEDVWQDEDFRLVEDLSEVARWSRPDEVERLLRAA